MALSILGMKPYNYVPDAFVAKTIYQACDTFVCYGGKGLQQHQQSNDKLKLLVRNSDIMDKYFFSLPRYE